MALPPFDPAVKLIDACPSPAVATKDVGAAGVVEGVTETAVEAVPSPLAFTAFR